MALLEASPVYEHTEALFGVEESELLEPSIEELEAIEAETAHEIIVDPLTLMKDYVLSLRGEKFATRDVSKFEPDYDAIQRKLFMQRFLNDLLKDDELAPRLRAEGNTKARAYWLASVLTVESVKQGPDWFEQYANIELDTFEIKNTDELWHVQRLLRQLHELREDGIKEINGFKIKEIFAACNASIAAFASRTTSRPSLNMATVAVRQRNVPFPDEKVDEVDFTDFANCMGVDPDLFFPERGASTREAKEVCRSCVVQEECLEFALVTGQKFGIWGGKSERERRRMRRQRSLVAKAAAVAE